MQRNGAITLECLSLNLVNEEASHILNTFIAKSSNFTLLHQIIFANNRLMRIPPEIRLFPRLTQLHFGHNMIESISAVDFNFTSSNGVDEEEMIQIFLLKLKFFEKGLSNNSNCYKVT